MSGKRQYKKDSFTGKKRKGWNWGKRTKMPVRSSSGWWGLRQLAVFAGELRRWCLTVFCMRLCLRRRFAPMGLHKKILNITCLLILLIHTKHKTIRWNLGLNPRLHSLEEEFIHWIGMPKNLWLTVGQLFRYFSCKHKVANIGVRQENPELPLPPNSFYSNQTQNNKI